MFPTADDFRIMAEHTQTGILVHEAVSKNIRWANPAACAMFGFTLEELRPLKAHHMSAQEKQYRRQHGVAWLQEAVDHGQARRIWKYRSKDGRDFLADILATLVHFNEGPMVLVQFRNIDSEVELQQELVRTTDYLTRIMTHASTGVVLLGDDGRITDAARFVCEVMGLRPDELIGRKLEELGRLTSQVNQDQTVTPSGLNEPPDDLMLRVERPDGSIRWLSAMRESIDHDGISSTAVMMRDITARVELQRENALQEAHLQYLARYNAMGDMAMTLAHELGQPLAAATNFLSGLQSRLDAGVVDRSAIRYALTKSRRQLDRTAEIVASVRRYVQRIESNAGPVDLNEILAESLYFCSLRAAEKGIELTSDFSAEPLPLTGEHILIGQVVINFCSNAIDEAALDCSAAKRVHVRSFADGDWVCASVTDWGRGLATVQRGSAHGPMPTTTSRLQLNAFSSKQDGAGIGLVLSQRIVERHQGEVLVEGNDPGGTVITVRLPRATPWAEPVEATEA